MPQQRLSRARENTRARMRHSVRRMLMAIEQGDTVAAKAAAQHVAAEAMTMHTVNPDRPPILDGIRLDQIPDAKIEALVAPTSPVLHDDHAVDLVLAEIDRRDDAARAEQEGNAFLASCLAVRNRDHGAHSVAQLGRRLDSDWGEACSQIDAVIFGQSGEPPTRVQRAAHQLLGSRRASAPTKQEQRASAEADWRALMAQRYLEAEECCRGRMLNRASENRGLDERRLFTENASWASDHQVPCILSGDRRLSLN